MEGTATECEIRRRERQGALAKRIFGSPILQVNLCSFLTLKDLLSLWSSCKFLQQQEKPEGLLPSAIEEAIKPLLPDSDGLLAEALVPNGYCFRWRLLSCRCAVKPQERFAIGDHVAGESAEPTGTVRQKVHLEGHTKCESLRVVSPTETNGMKRLFGELSVASSELTELSLRSPQLSLKNHALFFLNLRCYWRQAARATRPTGSKAGFHSPAGCSETKAVTWRPATLPTAEVAGQLTVRAAGFRESIIYPERAGLMLSSEMEVAALKGAAIGTADANDAAAGASIDAATSAPPPLVYGCLGALQWPWESSVDRLLVSHGGSWCFVLRQRGNGVIIYLPLSRSADLGSAVSTGDVTYSSSTTCPALADGPPAPARVVAPAGAAARTVGTSATASPSSVTVQDGLKIATLYSSSVREHQGRSSTSGRSSSRSLSGSTCRYDKAGGTAALKATAVLPLAGQQLLQQESQDHFKRCPFGLDHGGLVWASLRPQLCEEAGLVVVPLWRPEETPELVAWSPTKPTGITRRQFPKLHSLTVATLPVQHCCVSSGCSSSCSLACNNCQAPAKELVIVGHGAKLRFLLPQTLNPLPVTLCRGDDRPPLARRRRPIEQPQQRQCHRLHGGLPVLYLPDGYSVMVSSYCLIAVPRFAFLRSGNRPRGVTVDSSTYSSSTESGNQLSYNRGRPVAASGNRESSSNRDSSGAGNHNFDWEQARLLDTAPAAVAHVWPILHGLCSSERETSCDCCCHSCHLQQQTEVSAKGTDFWGGSFLRFCRSFSVAIGENGANAASLSDNWFCFSFRDSMTLGCFRLFRSWKSQSGAPLPRRGSRRERLIVPLHALTPFAAIARSALREYRSYVSCVECRHVSLATCRRLFGGKANQFQELQEQQHLNPTASAPCDSALLIAVSLELGTICFGVLAHTGSLSFLQQQEKPQQQQQEQQNEQDDVGVAADSIPVLGHGSSRWSFTLLWLNKARHRHLGIPTERMEIRLSSGTLLYDSEENSRLLDLQTGAELLGQESFATIAADGSGSRLVGVTPRPQQHIHVINSPLRKAKPIPAPTEISGQQVRPERQQQGDPHRPFRAAEQQRPWWRSCAGCNDACGVWHSLTCHCKSCILSRDDHTDCCNKTPSTNSNCEAEAWCSAFCYEAQKAAKLLS